MADSRWELARERTQLAWVRFSLACSLLAIAVVVLVPPEVPTILVVTLGGLVAVAGLYAATRLFRT